MLGNVQHQVLIDLQCWGYTYTSTREGWEYCNDRKCSTPGTNRPSRGKKLYPSKSYLALFFIAVGPTRSPVVFQAFSTGPYKISIEWQPVPLPFVHGTPRGFRIRISKFGGNDPIVNTTGVDIKYFEVENLQPLTDYTLSVLEFNEIRDGPWSRPVYVQTMPQSK